MLVTASGLRNGFLFISRRRQSHRRSIVQILNKLSIDLHNGCQPTATQRLSTVGYCNPPSVMSGTPRLGGGGGGTRRGVLERLLTQRRSRHVPVAGGCERSRWFALDATPLCLALQVLPFSLAISHPCRDVLPYKARRRDVCTDYNHSDKRPGCQPYYTHVCHRKCVG